MPLTKLPPEITDTIINLLHDDNRSLTACSLTCKQWLPSARCCLFSEIKMTPHRIESLLMFLKWAPADIPLMVRRLVVDDFSEWALANDNLPYGKIRRILLHLRQVKRLRVSNCYSVITASVVSVLASVRELEMIDMRLKDVGQALQFVYAFPLLQNLSIVNLSLASSSLQPSKYDVSPGLPSFSIRSLILDEGTFAIITKWLLGLNSVPPIHTLRRHAYDLNTPRSDAALLHSVGTSLHTLELKFWNYLQNCCSGNHYLIDVTNFINLRKLHLSDIPTDHNSNHTHISYLCTILSQIPSHNIEELTLEFIKPDGIDFDWSSLAAILDGPAFSRLQYIHVESHVSDTIPGEDKVNLVRDAWRMAERSIRRGALSAFGRHSIFYFTLFKYEGDSRVDFVTSEANMTE